MPAQRPDSARERTPPRPLLRRKSARTQNVTSCSILASRLGLASTYIAVVRMLARPAISAIGFRSTPQWASDNDPQPAVRPAG